MRIFNADLSVVLFVLLCVFVAFEFTVSALLWERGKKKLAVGLFCMAFILAVCFLIMIIFGAVNWGW